MSSSDLPTIRQVLARVHLQLIVFAVLLAATSVTLSGGLVIHNYAQRNLDLMARTLAYTIAPSVAFGDQRAVVDGIAMVAGVGGVQQVEVLDRAGRILVRWQNPRPAGPAWLMGASSWLLWPRSTVVPMAQDGNPIGEVRITGNSEGLLRFGLAGLIIALSSLALAMIAAGLLARRLQSHVIGPLEHVAEVAQAIHTQRSYDQRVQEVGVAEIDRFRHHFNALIEEWKGWQSLRRRDDSDCEP